MTEELSQFVSDSTAVFQISLLESLNQIAEETSNGDIEQSYFKPKYTYPVFGDEESIFGYKDLTISLFLGSAGLDPFLKLQFSEVVQYKQHGAKPDDIIAKFKEVQTVPQDIINALQWPSPHVSNFYDFIPTPWEIVSAF